MPRIAMATSAVERIADSDDEASTTRVDDLIQRGRSQGHLSLAELRTAFDQAGLTPAEGRSILRELSEAGVRLANELAQPESAGAKGGSRSRSARSAPARAAKRSEEHTSELQSRLHLVCRLLLEKKKKSVCTRAHLVSYRARVAFPSM